MAARTPRGLKMLSSLCPVMTLMMHSKGAAVWVLQQGHYSPPTHAMHGRWFCGVAKQAGWCLADMADAKAELHFYCIGGVCTPLNRRQECGMPQESG